MISYAQNREDVLLDRAFPRGLKGFYVDVGAHDPTLNSVTRHFYDLGWRGINIEPAGEPFQKLVQARPRDVNLNLGVAETEGTLKLFKSPPEAGWSTFSKELAAHHRNAGIDLEEVTVPVTTLAQICDEHVASQTIDFMSIDVEGFERQVIEGGDWKRYRPRIVVVESTEPGKTVPTHPTWEHLLVDARYLFAAFDGLNRYYVRSEDADLLPVFEAPANVFDEFVVYQHVKAIRELRAVVGRLERQLAASRAAKSDGESSDRLEDLDPLQALAETRAQQEDLRRMLEVSSQELKEMREQLDTSSGLLKETLKQLRACSGEPQGGG
jgi:FkbM family methyltransferase